MLALIQARLSSKRFRKKVLCKINDKTTIEHVFDRVKKSKKIKKIIVATSKNKSDDELVKFLKKRKINYSRGSLNNVAMRLLKVAKKEKEKSFLRICADSPAIDYKVIDKCILLKEKYSNKDIITNIFPRTFPKGQSVEIIKTKLLEKNIIYMDKNQKEHVTNFFYKNYKKFKIKNFLISKKFFFKSNNLCLDTKTDLKFLKKIL